MGLNGIMIPISQSYSYLNAAGLYKLLHEPCRNMGSFCNWRVL